MSVIDPEIPDQPFPPKPLFMDPADIYDNFDRRIHRLEQMLTGTFAGQLSYTAEGNFPDGVTIGGTPIGNVPPDTVTNVVASPGAFFDNLYVDVTWDEALTGVPAVSFDIDIAEVTAGPTYTILNVFNTGATNIRINNLAPNKSYAVRVSPVNAIGVRGVPSAWVPFTSVPDSTIPPAPTGLVIARGATTVVVKFTGLTDAQAPDVAWGHGTYEIQIDTTAAFNTGNFRQMISTATVVAFNDIVGELPQWYARVRAIDSSGNASAWSTVAGPSGPAGGVNDSMIIADLNAAKIQFGTMSGDRIAVNTLDAGTIKTSSITSANITLAGGSFRAGNPVPGSSPGVLINSQGIRLYNTTGALTFTADAATGNVAITGTISASTITGSTINGGTITGALIQTSSTGQRIVLNAGTDSIEFYSGDVSESNRGEIYTNIIPVSGPHMILRGPKQAAGPAAQIVLWGAASGGVPSEVYMYAETTAFYNELYPYAYFYANEHGFRHQGMGGGENKFQFGGDLGNQHLQIGESSSSDLFFVMTKTYLDYHMDGGRALLIQKSGGDGSMVLQHGQGGSNNYWELKTAGVTGRIWTRYGYFVEDAGTGLTGDVGFNGYYAAFRARSVTWNGVVALSAETSGVISTLAFELGDGWSFYDSFMSGGDPLWAFSFNTFSSADFKENIRDVEVDEFDGVLDNLRPRKFRHKGGPVPIPDQIDVAMMGTDLEDIEGLERATIKRDEAVGFIAEEMYEVFPQAVKLKKGEPKGIDYAVVIALLVSETQKQNARITELEAALN